MERPKSGGKKEEKMVAFLLWKRGAPPQTRRQTAFQSRLVFWLSNFSQGSRHLVEASGYLVTSAGVSTWLSLPRYPSSTLLCNAQDLLVQRGGHVTQWLHPTMEFVAVPFLSSSARASQLPLQPRSGCCVPSYPCSVRHLKGAAQKHTHSTSLEDCKRHRAPPQSHPSKRKEPLT